MRTAPVVAVLTTLSTVLLVSPAFADLLDSTRGMPVREITHSVDVELRDGVAIYTVRRSFLNEGDRADQVYLEIRLPEGASASGLRIRARGTWYDGELMGRERARTLYEELTGVGPHEPKDPALLEWENPGELRMHLFPVFAGEASTVEYTLRAPTKYRDGTYHLTYPKPSNDRSFVDPVVSVDPDSAASAIRIAGRRATAGQPVALSDPRAERGADAESADSDSGCEGLDVRPVASCAASHTWVSVSPEEPTIEATAKIRHPAPENVRPRLVSPAGRVFELDLREGDDGAVFRINRTLRPEVETAGTWRLVVSDFVPGASGTLESWSLALGEGSDATTVTGDGLPLALPDAESDAPSRSLRSSGTARIEIDAAFDDRLRARLGRARAGSNREFARLETDVAPRLSELPEGANFVFLVDASHSVADETLEAQLRLIRAMLHHVPDADFDVVAYRRFPSRFGGGFASAEQAGRVLSTARENGFFERGNGSHLGRALVVGRQALTGRSGPKFLVACTDHLLRTAWTNELADRALAGLPEATTLHVVEPERSGSADPALDRVDDDPLAPIALKRGGIMVELEGADGDRPEAMNRTALHLVRPTRIENVAIRGIDLRGPRDHLDEGTSIREMIATDAAPGRVTIRGDLWARPVRHRIYADKPFSRATAGFVFSHDMHQALNETQMRRLARFGGVVSPVTSFLAIEPGVRPSSIGIDRGGMGIRGRGFGGGAAGMRRVQADLQFFEVAAYLKRRLEKCVAEHDPPDSQSPSVTVETTHHEIVDVDPSPASDSPLARCLSETAWATDLPPNRRYPTRNEYDIHLSSD